MAKSVTVTFDDGSTHIYDGVPDDASDDQINSRAQTDFPSLTITGTSSGANNPPPAVSNATQNALKNPSSLENIAAGAQTAYQLGNEFLSSPVGHAVEAGGATAYGGNKLLEAAKALRQPPAAPAAAPPVAPVAPESIPKPVIQVPQNTGGVPRPMTAPAPQMAPPQANALGELGNFRPGTPAVGGPAAQEGANFIQRMARQFAPMAESVAPVLQKIAPIVNNPITRFATGPVGQFIQGAAYSPSTGPQTPTSGPYRGMEINPMTHRPWTAAEIQQANQMPPPVRR